MAHWKAFRTAGLKGGGDKDQLSSDKTVLLVYIHWAMGAFSMLGSSLRT